MCILFVCLFYHGMLYYLFCQYYKLCNFRNKKICLYSVIPSLLPFMLITNYMQAHNLCTTVSAIFYPIFNKLMSLSEYGTFALIIGFTSGYPMGAKIIGDLYSANNISFKEAKLLITFCNISSISFLINYVLNKCLNNCIPPWLIILFVYLPPLLTGLFNSCFIKFTNNNNTVHTESTFNSIHATFYSLAKLSIYIICFNILVNFIININKIPVLQKIYNCWTNRNNHRFIIHIN